MKTTLLIAAAGLGLVAAISPARAQFYGWGYYRPYYPVPYGYYPGPYYAPPPPVYDGPPPGLARRHVSNRLPHYGSSPRHRGSHRALVNPLLGPLPGPASRWRN